MPKNFEAPLSYRVSTVLIKIVTLMSIFVSKITKIPEPIIIRAIVDAFFYLKPKCQILNNTVKIENIKLKNVPVRIYTPTSDSSEKMACLIYFHGGGFFAGNVDMYDYYLNTISIQLNIVVISVEYRLCPEHMYPAAIEDCWNVVQFYIENSQLFNTDLNRTIIGGDSAGANLTSVITQRIAENESISFRPKFVIYITPFFQLFNLELPSIRRYFPCGIISYFSFYTGKLIYWYLGETNLNREMNEVFINNLHTLAVEDENLREKYKKLISIDLIPEVYKKNRDYYGDEMFIYPSRHEEPRLLKNNLKIKKKINFLFNKDISPALVDQTLLQKMPPKAYFIIYECDQVKDDGLIFAKRLELAGIDVKIAFYEDCYHGQTQFVDPVNGFESSRVVLNDMIKYIRKNI